MPVLTEDAVIDSLRASLVADGWEIVSRARVSEHGADLIATRGGTRLEVEAKGAGSSKPGTARYGQMFNRAQVFVHVGEALVKALRVASAGHARAAIALPDNRDHRSEIALIRDALRRLGIIVFWVADDGTVSSEGFSDD